MSKTGSPRQHNEGVTFMSLGWFLTRLLLGRRLIAERRPSVHHTIAPCNWPLIAESYYNYKRLNGQNVNITLQNGQCML